MGGFRSTAYPAGAVLERVEVRQLEEKGRQELIRRIEASTATVHFSPTSTGQDQAAMLQSLQQQQTQTLNRLRSEPAVGRLVINITSNISEWENTPADIYLRAGDVITIPRKPNFVLAYGQVYNPTAVTYQPGKNCGVVLGAGWWSHGIGAEESDLCDQGERVRGFIARKRVVQGERSKYQAATGRHPGSSRKGAGRIFGLEDDARNCLTGREPGSCRSRCCSFLALSTYALRSSGCSLGFERRNILAVTS